MIINQKKDGRTLTIMPVGQLDSTTSDDFQSVIEREFTEDFDLLVIDFTQVDYISSKGLRVLLSACKHLGGRKMELTGLNTAVREVLRMTGFSEIFAIE